MSFVLASRSAEYHLPLNAVTYVGRDGCDILLKSRSVESRHALLSYDPSGEHFVLRDLNSTNGTAVNGETVIDRSVHLRPGDRIRFGHDPVTYTFKNTAETNLAREAAHALTDELLRATGHSITSRPLSTSPLPMPQRPIHDQTEPSDVRRQLYQPLTDEYSSLPQTHRSAFVPVAAAASSYQEVHHVPPVVSRPLAVQHARSEHNPHRVAPPHTAYPANLEVPVQDTSYKRRSGSDWSWVPPPVSSFSVPSSPSHGSSYHARSASDIAKPAALHHGLVPSGFVSPVSVHGDTDMSLPPPGHDHHMRQQWAVPIDVNLIGRLTPESPNSPPSPPVQKCSSAPTVSPLRPEQDSSNRTSLYGVPAWWGDDKKEQQAEIQPVHRSRSPATRSESTWQRSKSPLTRSESAWVSQLGSGNSSHVKGGRSDENIPSSTSSRRQSMKASSDRTSMNKRATSMKLSSEKGQKVPGNATQETATPGLRRREPSPVLHRENTTLALRRAASLSRAGAADAARKAAEARQKALSSKASTAKSKPADEPKKCGAEPTSSVPGQPRENTALALRRTVSLTKTAMQKNAAGQGTAAKPTPPSTPMSRSGSKRVTSAGRPVKADVPLHKATENKSGEGGKNTRARWQTIKAVGRKSVQENKGDDSTAVLPTDQAPPDSSESLSKATTETSSLNTSSGKVLQPRPLNRDHPVGQPNGNLSVSSNGEPSSDSSAVSTDMQTFSHSAMHQTPHSAQVETSEASEESLQSSSTSLFESKDIQNGDQTSSANDELSGSSDAQLTTIEDLKHKTTDKDAIPTTSARRQWNKSERMEGLLISSIAVLCDRVERASLTVNDHTVSLLKHVGGEALSESTVDIPHEDRTPLDIALDGQPAWEAEYEEMARIMRCLRQTEAKLKAVDNMLQRLPSHLS